jgi:hypothetical protein
MGRKAFWLTSAARLGYVQKLSRFCNCVKTRRHCRRKCRKNRAAGKLGSLFMIFPTRKKSSVCSQQNASTSSSLKFLLFSLFSLFISSTFLDDYARISSPARHVDYSNSVSQNTSNDYKGAVYQNETNISSPARRSEVSPIQNHVSILDGVESGLFCAVLGEIKWIGR